MKRLFIMAILTLLFFGAWVDGQYDQTIDPLAWTVTEDPNDPNEVVDPNGVVDPNEVVDPNDVDDPEGPGE